MSPTPKLRGLALAGAVAVGGLASCAVGPDYHPAAASTEAAWQSPIADGLTDRSGASSTWWTSFNDAELDSLVGRTAQANLDLRAAEARLRQARAVRSGISADLWPTLGANASEDRARQSEHQPLIGSLPLPANFPFEYTVYQAGFDASWEIDLFGGKRRALEAATADWHGAIEARNDVLLSVLAEVARNYVELRGAQRRLAIERHNLELEQEALELTSARLRAGIATDLDVSRSAALLDGVKAALPPLETAQRSAMYALAVLLGLQPGELVAELSAPAVLPPPPPIVPIGLPSDLLRRRPDVRRAERELAAETARIGVAKADWFPKVSLTGDFGAESVSSAKWFQPGSRFWSIGPSVQWQALDFGRVRAEVRVQTAVQEAALATYQKAVLVSLQEAENALLAYAEEQNRRDALAATLTETRHSLELAESLYAQGRVSFFEVLDARRSLYTAEDQLAQSDQSISLDLIALYKALGGGWETLGPAPASAAAASTPASAAAASAASP